MIYSLFLCFSIAGVGCNYIAGPFNSIGVCHQFEERYEQGKVAELAQKHMRYVCMKKPGWTPTQ
jgi:hypothetical protein